MGSSRSRNLPSPLLALAGRPRAPARGPTANPTPSHAPPAHGPGPDPRVAVGGGGWPGRAGRGSAPDGSSRGVLSCSAGGADRAQLVLGPAVEPPDSDAGRRRLDAGQSKVIRDARF